MLLITLSLFAVTAMLRQLNFYKIILMLKRYARKVERLRFEIRAMLHTGFRDYYATLDEQNSSRNKITSCVWTPPHFFKDFRFISPINLKRATLVTWDAWVWLEHAKRLGGQRHRVRSSLDSSIFGVYRYWQQNGWDCCESNSRGCYSSGSTHSLNVQKKKLQRNLQSVDGALICWSFRWFVVPSCVRGNRRGLS